MITMGARLALLILGVFWMGVTVFAQGGPQPDDPSTSPLQWYTSVGGVGLATLFAVSMLKRAVGTAPYFSRVPTWLYAVVVAFLLTLLCVEVLGTLPGNLWQLAWQAIYNAAIASGIYEWVNHVNKPLSESAEEDAPVRATRKKKASSSD